MSSQVPSSNHYPRSLEARLPFVGHDGSAFHTVQKFTFNTSLSGIDASGVGTYTIGYLEPNYAYYCKAIECVATVA